jgi:hypothetical protein
MEITAQFNNVPIDRAILVLADAAGLKPVVLGNLIYVTSKENADRLEAEQKGREPQKYQQAQKSQPTP